MPRFVLAPALIWGACLALDATVPMAAAIADSTCPTVRFYCYSTSETRKDDRGDFSCSDPNGSGFAHYDLPAGSVSAGVTGSQSQDGGLQAEDEYRIIGLPDGTPLVFKARFIVSLQQCSYYDYEGFLSIASASLAEGTNADQASIGNVEGCHAKNDSLEIVLSHLAGEAFRLVLAVAGSGVSASAEGVLSFVGLPPGAVVNSCHGFRQDAPTAARPVTWGRLKSLYR